MRKLLLRVAAALMAVLAVAQAQSATAQSSPDTFMSATRYDLAGRVTGTISPDPDGAGALPFLAVRNSYDDRGNLVKVENGSLTSWQSENVLPANWTTWTLYTTTDVEYDLLNRKTKETARDKNGVAVSVTQYNYDIVGRPQCTAVRMNPPFTSLPTSACTQGVAADQITKTVYDPVGQVAQIRDGVGSSVESAEVTYSYTDNGKRKFVIDANGNRAELRYDGFDRQIRWVFPSTTKPLSYNDSSQSSALSSAGSVNEADFEAYTWDKNGNRLSLRTRRNETLNYTFDNLNRMTFKDVPTRSGLSTVYTRDVYYGYDFRGLQTYARFDSATGQGLTNNYDGFGRLTSTIQAMDGTSRTLSYLYDSDGNRTRLTYPDNLYVTYNYDYLDRLTYADKAGVVYTAAGQVDHRGSVGPTYYSYDDAQRLSALRIVSSSSTYDVTWTFGWTPSRQLSQETRYNDTYAFTFVNVNKSYSNNGLNEYTAVGGVSYSYDANGNLTSDGATTFTYDVENRLIYGVGAKTGYLRYDPLGRLYEMQNSGGAYTRLLNDGDDLVAEYDGSANLLRRYVHAGGSGDDPIEWYEGAGMLDPALRTLGADRLGSIALVTSYNTGTAIGANKYDEYGNPASGNFGRFQYTGQAWIPELGLYYYKARMYAPAIGRFMQVDPIGYKDQFNLYTYVGNDPINGTDAKGMYECKGDKQQCATFKKFRQNLRDAARRTPTGSILRDSRLSAADDAVGSEGDGGVNITFNAEEGAQMGSFDEASNTINIDSAKIIAAGNDRADKVGLTARKAIGLIGGGVLAHEAYHSVWRPLKSEDLKTEGRNHFFNEYAAYSVELNYYNQWDYPSAFGSQDLSRRAAVSCYGSAASIRHPDHYNQFVSGCSGKR